MAVSEESENLRTFQLIAKSVEGNGDVFPGFLQGIATHNVTGCVTVTCNNIKKDLFFNEGALVFAGSSLIDDRLGEILYRSGKITIDQMADAAVQVTNKTKFGRALVKGGVHRFRR